MIQAKTTEDGEEAEKMEVDQAPVEEEVKPKVEETAAPGDQKFMFNIADGGFTELHTIWQNEQRAIQEQNREAEIWHRKHDYWLLAGVLKHGYGRWQDIHNDLQYAIVNEPFKQDADKANQMDLQNRFLARRFKLLEQALVIEEQLRRASHMNICSDQGDQVQNLNRRFVELECLANSHQQVYNQALAGNKTLVPTLHRALTMMEEILSEMKGDVAKLGSNLQKMPPVAQRLGLSHTNLITRLTQQLNLARQQQLAAQQAKAEAVKTEAKPEVK
ncbi:choline dehydrogenase 3 [Cichlidogyrus casuarinus]|uniref:Choline dehydrogenase 3 n=1 Tax=Cichlidogyrus casuarinus TaxID=1844966 RepID=A0ABD2QF13_9PLAT